MAYPRGPKRTSRRNRSATFRLLTAAAAAFDHRTRIIDNKIDARQEVWRLRFDNRHTIVFCADGTCKIVRE